MLITQLTSRQVTPIALLPISRATFPAVPEEDVSALIGVLDHVLDASA